VSATVNIQDELTSVLWAYKQTVQVITTSSANIGEKQCSVGELWSDRLQEKLLRQSVHPILQARMYYVDNLGDYHEFSKQELILSENLHLLCTLL